jgi:RhtB (resistance to homoserine/threonine) family protein
MSRLPEFLTVVVIHLLAVMLPGPDFVMISRNSLVYSRRTGVYAAAGVGLGIPVHVTYSLVGIGLVIARSLALFTILKFAGAAYLIYLGVKSLLGGPAAPADAAGHSQLRELRPTAAIRVGFLTNVLNPKATLFFLALFTQVISPGTPKWLLALYGAEMSLMTFAWFAFVAVVLSHARVKARFVAIQPRLEKLFGVILIGLGVKVALYTHR